MVTFYTDADRTGAGEFVEAQVSLATEFTLPAGQITRFRWPFPSVAPSISPAIRLYSSAGSLVASVPFDTAVLSAWNWATPGSPISVAAGTYRATVTTTRYPARTGFFSGGAVTRGDITAVQGRFGSGDAAPASTSTATYFVDIDFTASAGQSVAPAGLSVVAAVGAPSAAWSGGVAPGGQAVAVALGAPSVGAASVNPGGLSVPVAVGGPAVGWSGSVAPVGLSVAVAVGSPVVGAAPVAPDGLSVPVALGAVSLSWSAAVAPDGIGVPVAAGTVAVSMPGTVVVRPFTGTVVRPAGGVVVRPDAGVVSRP